MEDSFLRLSFYALRLFSMKIDIFLEDKRTFCSFFRKLFVIRDIIYIDFMNERRVKGIWHSFCRRRIYNYTVLTLDKEGSIPDFEIFSAAAIRVRDGKEVATYLCPDFPTDAKKRTEEVNRLRTFIGNDMVITCDISGMTPVMESLYMNSIEAFFTNATLDLLTVEEEVEKSVPDPKPFHERMSHFRRVVEPLERAPRHARNL